MSIYLIHSYHRWFNYHDGKIIAFLGNITKIASYSELTPYLQFILIKNNPLTHINVIHTYMPSHDKDILYS